MSSAMNHRCACRSESSHRRAHGLTHLGIALALSAISCGSEVETSPWISLTKDFVPSTQITAGSSWRVPFIGGDELTLEKEQGGEGVWITARLKSEAWSLAPFGSTVWSAKRPFWGAGIPALEGAIPQRLESGEDEFIYVPFTKKLLNQELPVDSFTGVLEQVYLKTDGQRPSDSRYAVFVERGRSVDGNWRIGLERYTADGFPLWSGQAEEFVTDVPANSVLSFGVAGSATAKQLGEVAGTVTFRVLFDGREIHSHAQEVRELVQAARYRVELPPEARRSVQLRFEIEGAAAVCAVLDPRIGPLAPQSTPKRPNVLLFLADTFRADNLTAYGASYSKSLTPRIDEFATASVVFTRSWSPASWTLPAQASMMTGLYPDQHGAGEAKRKVTTKVTTLAEAFASAGYRTGAITDSLYVSHRFGFDQGFQWFDEGTRTIEETIGETREFIEADDGRPFFLFVQTYRTHTPYLASEQTRAEYAYVLDLGKAWGPLWNELEARTATLKVDEPLPKDLKAIVARVEQLYRGGVVDLDRAFGQMLADLKQSGREDDTWVVFTSDHGESFGEHDRMFHGNGVWESDVRIPLIIRGPLAVPRQITSAASLVDLPRTLAGVAGFQAHVQWGGRDLFGELVDRTAFSFESPASGKAGLVMMVEKSQKVIFEHTDEAIEQGEIYAAYDLESDRLELREYDSNDVEWAKQLMKSNAAELNGLSRELFKAPKAQLRAEDVENLAAVGYVDEE